MPQFIRIGTHYLNPDHIIEINTDLVKETPQTWEENGATCRGHRPVHYVRVVTSEVYGTENGGTDSVYIDFKHGTDEARAIIDWVEVATEVIVHPRILS